MVASRLAETVLAQHFPTCDVLLAQRASDGFERFHLALPDLVLLDDSLPDMELEAVCHRFLNAAELRDVPLVLMTGEGADPGLEKKYDNVFDTLRKPVSEEALTGVLKRVLGEAKPKPAPSSVILFRDAERTLFAGHTGFFSLRSALQMAFTDQLSGILRFFIHQHPVELFISKGRFVFATTRDFHLYCRESPVILSSTNLGLITEAQANQHATGCPIFLYLSSRTGFPHEDVVQITREHGQRLFANLWTAGRVTFEFEQTTEFPEYARNFPPTPEDPENWVLASLRHVKYDSFMSAQRPDPNGSPAYTRKGYELVQKLKLNDVEARFATAINGSESLQQIAKKVNIPLNDALLIVFRFQALDIIDYWSASVLSLPASATNPAGGEAKSDAA